MNWGFGKKTVYNTELDIQFDIGLLSALFAKWFISDLYSHVLTDCYNKANGIKPEDEGLFFDSCVTTEQAKGLITLLAQSMEAKQKIYLSYEKGIVVEVKDTAEKQRIDKMSKSGGEKGFVICDFTGFPKTDLLRVCARMLYATIKATHTGLNITQALQLKISKLREAVSNNDASRIIDDAKIMAQSIKDGKPVLLDKDDDIVSPSFNIEPAEKSINLINGLCANFMGGFPLSYVNGALTTGISATGEGDETAVNRALKGYFNSILRPVVKALTGADITFKEDSWRKLESIGNLLPLLEGTFLIDDKVKKELIEGALR